MTILICLVIGQYILFWTSDIKKVISVQHEQHATTATTTPRPAASTSSQAGITASSSSSSSSFERSLLQLDVPYYVYDELLWLNATFGNKPVKELAAGRYKEEFHPKHSNDYYFMLASLKHPMRTFDPDQAELFVIPILLNTYDRRVTYYGKFKKDLCFEKKCNFYLMKHAATIIQNSVHYQKYPQRHVIVASHFARIPKRTGRQGKDSGNKLPSNMNEILSKVSTIHFENRHLLDIVDDDNNNNNTTPAVQQPVYVPFVYVGERCVSRSSTSTTPPSSSQSSHKYDYDVTLIASMNPTNPNFIDRTNICNWLHSSSNNDDDNSSSIRSSSQMNIFCGTTASYNEYCPILSKSKYGFHVRGDSYGSNRLIDLILTGVIPIFTHYQQYDILPPFVNWQQLSYYIEMGEGDNRISKDDFLRQLNDIVQDRDASNSYEGKKQYLLSKQYLFDWMNEPIYPFDRYMSYIQDRLLKQEAKNQN